MRRFICIRRREDIGVSGNGRGGARKKKRSMQKNRPARPPSGRRAIPPSSFPFAFYDPPPHPATFGSLTHDPPTPLAGRWAGGQRAKGRDGRRAHREQRVPRRRRGK